MKKAKLPREWRLLQRESGPDLIISRVRYDWRENPRNGKQLKCVILESGDWVNIVAVTPAQKLVTVRQFRFGIEKVTLEIPGGLVDPGEVHEAAARRELQEETGYTTENWAYLGSCEVNPAIRGNICHHWLAKDVELTHATAFDEGEDLTIELLSLEEIRHAIRTGEMRHSLVLLALSQVFDIWESSV